jgi:hypothetical protein
MKMRNTLMARSLSGVLSAGGGQQPKEEGRGSEFEKFEGPCTSAFQKMLAAACRLPLVQATRSSM